MLPVHTVILQNWNINNRPFLILPSSLSKYSQEHKRKEFLKSYLHGQCSNFSIKVRCREEQNSCLNQTLFDLFFHFGKSEILLKSKAIVLMGISEKLSQCTFKPLQIFWFFWTKFLHLKCWGIVFIIFFSQSASGPVQDRPIIYEYWQIFLFRLPMSP